jgi:hypothetical protein
MQHICARERSGQVHQMKIVKNECSSWQARVKIRRDAGIADASANPVVDSDQRGHVGGDVALTCVQRGSSAG